MDDRGMSRIAIFRRIHALAGRFSARSCAEKGSTMNEARDEPVHVTVTGAAGQVAYALLFRIASGELLGPDTPVVLRLLEIEPALPALEGVAMELEDSAYPLLSDLVITSNLNTAFDRASWALLLGSMPRKEGMERGHLLAANGGIFRPQGRAIAEHGAPDVRVLVVGNPCNTNCLVARANAPEVPDDRWFAMTRLDENRAKAQLAQKAGVPVREVTNLAIWGNHSATQYPDARNAKIAGHSVPNVIEDHEWLDTEFISRVQERGAAIIAARGHSSAGSAAEAVVDTVHMIHKGTPPGDWASVANVSNGEYGIPKGLLFSFPTVSDGEVCSVAEGIHHDSAAMERIRVTTEELVHERDLVADLVPR